MTIEKCALGCWNRDMCKHPWNRPFNEWPYDLDQELKTKMPNGPSKEGIYEELELPPRVEPGNMPTLSPMQRELLEFRGMYGRYCNLAAQLLKDDIPSESIINARITRLTALPKFAALYDAWQPLGRKLEELKARGDIGPKVLGDTARQAKSAVEEEWDVSIPMTVKE